MQVDRIVLHRLALPLTVPYKLSLGVVERLDTLLVELHCSDGSTGWGEATVLHGYTEETIEQAWQTACQVARRLPGCDRAALEAVVNPLHDEAPFTGTALLSAMEMAAGDALLETPSGARVPLLAILNNNEGPDLEREIEGLLANGYRTLKVKVGFDLEPDMERVGRIQGLVAGRAKLRIDANQGFTREEGCRFVAEIDPTGVELVEQTCAAGDWDAAVAVARVANVPMMLDESIYGLEDVERAAELRCASYIKFKLMKAGGLRALVSGLERIRALGMEPVLGNGVASDIGCWMEACVSYHHLSLAGEMNGFLKPRQCLLKTPLQVEDGHVVLPDRAPEIDLDKLAAVTVEQQVFD